ncbi:MAG TPA: peptidase M20 [Firmicutes bacterium]|nr:peptidase M20 [Bacillota bacterium]
MFLNEKYTNGNSLAAEMVDEFCALARIDAESGREGELSNVVAAKLEDLGLEVVRDDAGRRFGGETGNVIGRLPGQMGGEPILLCAHLDRVAPGCGIQPVVLEDRIVSSGDTVLAADDIVGVVAILAGMRLALAECVDLPPIEVVFTVSEENGLAGAKYMDYSAVRSKMGYVLDAARPVGTVVLRSPTHIGLEVAIHGRAAHAGINPEEGISALQIAADSLMRIPFGKVDDHTTANMGVVKGGHATNIVCEHVDLSGEVRSLDHPRALRLAEELAECFRKTAAAHGGSAEVSISIHYPGYRIDSDSQVALRVQSALSRLGRSTVFESSMGGSDANMFNSHGIESVCLGVGFEQIHSCRESTAISELVVAAGLVRQLVASEG